MNRRSIGMAMVGLLTPIVMCAQVTIKGMVRDKNTNQPLVGARISYNDDANISSKNNGSFMLNKIKNGKLVLKVSYVGYKTQTLPLLINDRDTTLNIALETQSIITDEVTISASKANSLGEATFSNLNNINIKKNNFGQDLPIILNQLPSVNISSDAGNGVGYTNIRVRGSDASAINVTINGIPYNDSEGLGTFWVDLPDIASSANAIQLQRGVGTSTNGAGAFGASLNVQTNQVTDSASIDINNSFGSFNTIKNTIKLSSGILKKHWTFDTRLSRINSDGYIDRAFSKLKSYYVSGAYLGKTSLFRLNVFSGQEQTYQAWNGVPESELLKGNRTYNSFTYPNQTDNYTQDHYQFFYTQKISPKITFDGALHYTYGRGYYEEYQTNQSLTNYGLLPLTLSNGSTTFIQDTTNLVRQKWLKNHFYGGIYSLKYIPNNQLSLILGGGYNEYRGEHFGEIIWSQYASNSDINHRYYDNDAKKRDFNSYIKANYNLDQWRFFTDLQVRNVRFQYYELINEQKTSNQQQKANLLFFNPKAGITFEPNNWNQIYTSFSVANREPNRDDYVSSTAQNRPNHETLYNLETGYKWTQQHSFLHFNFYGMWYKNQLVRTGRLNNVGNSIRQNVPNSYRLGIELEGKTKIHKKIDWLANATFSKNKIKQVTLYFDSGYYYGDASIAKTYDNVDISFSPNIIAFSELQYHPIKNVEIAFNEKHIGKQYLDNTQSNDKAINSYWTSNIRVSYTFALKNVQRIELACLWNNIFSKKYENNGWTYSYFDNGTLKHENAYYPQALSNVMLSLNIKI